LSIQIVMVFIIGIVMVIGFASGKVSFSAVAISVIVALNVTGILSFKDAWAGYSSTIAILFASMFVLAASLSKTSLLSKIAEVILPEGSSERGLSWAAVYLQ